MRRSLTRVAWHGSRLFVSEAAHCERAFVLEPGVAAALLDAGVPPVPRSL